MPTEFFEAASAPSAKADESSLENVKVPYEANIQAKTEPVIETSEMEFERPQLQVHKVNMTAEKKQCVLYVSDFCLLPS